LIEPRNQELVEVVFDDLAEFDTNYTQDMTPVQCSAIGWMVEENQSFIRISWLKEKDDEPYVGLAIPTGCVKKIYRLGSSSVLGMERLN